MNVKACVAGALASVFFVGVAGAADLPSVKAAPYTPPPAFTWEGWHIGVVGGYGGGSFASTSAIYTVAPASTAFLNQSVGTSGWLVGYETGYSWQFSNNFVLGYESEFSYADVRSSNAFGNPGVRMEWFGAERLRFGYAMGHFMPYITGGLAYGRTKSDGFQALGGFLFPATGSRWQAGWTVGAGVEWMVYRNVSIKAEYLYTHLKGPNTFGVGAPNGVMIGEGRDFDTHLARAGVNFHFGDPMELIGLTGIHF